jgi:hypothetical protein
MASKYNHVNWIAGAIGMVTLSGAAQAQFVRNTADIPSGASNSSNTENVDFGDVDLDGDWDAVFADGGDNANDQNRIWINRGPGANIGKYLDETGARFPAINDQSRDIEFVDFDNDSDLDIYVSNTSVISPQGNRWWTNVGVGTGNYVDETAARWIGLNGSNSSIAASQILGDGTFIDFSCDCDFGDIDNDGDMDLFHSSYGGAFGGQVPSRIFLNDGAGFFTEFNPSGFKLAGQLIQSGNPGLWCEGTQSSDTNNTTGVNCDVASSALDIDLGDIDGDFDLDVLHGAREQRPRMFQNRLEENGGTLGFRDVTAATFPNNWATGNGHYEQEMGDLDGDGDLDIYGLNWQAGGFSFTDITLRNNGNGVYGNLTTLSGSGDDDNEGDFLDYDNDGDLDLFVANFSGQDRLYRNNINGGTNFSFTEVSFPFNNRIALDADCCDVDGDGDYDIIVANDNNAPNYYMENITQVADTHAPYLPNLEQAGNRTAGAAPTVVRVHVYDNAPYYITWYNVTTLTYTVDGSGGATIPALSSGGQIFRAEIPGNLVGTIAYSFTSSDEYGNAGSSAIRNYVASNGGSNFGSSYCAGDGSAGLCPCAAFGNTGQGCGNTTGVGGATLTGAGNASFGGDTFNFGIVGVPGNKPGLLLRGNNQVNSGNGNPIGDGLICTAGASNRSQVQVTVAGSTNYTNWNGAALGSVANMGAPTNFQFWYRDPSNTCSGSGFNFTNAWTVTYQP